MNLRETFLRTSVVIATIVGAYALYRLTDLVVVIFVAIILASTARPLVTWMTRYKVPVSLAIFLIYGIFFVLIIGLLVVAIPPVARLVMEFSQNNQLSNDLNFALVRSGLWLRRQFEVYVPILTLPPQFREFLESADETVAEQAWPFAQSAGNVLGQVLVAIVLSVYWLVARNKALIQLMRFTSVRYRNTVYNIWTETEDALGAYVRGQLILAGIVGIVSYVGLVVLQVPNARALAVLAGLFEMIPFVGPVIAAIPAVLMGFTVSTVTAVLVLVLYVVIQQVEGNYLVPRVMGHGLRLHPMVVLIAILVGFRLNGIAGAMLALPLASALQITVHHLRRMPTEDETGVVASGRIPEEIRAVGDNPDHNPANPQDPGEHETDRKIPALPAQQFGEASSSSQGD